MVERGVARIRGGREGVCSALLVGMAVANMTGFRVRVVDFGTALLLCLALVIGRFEVGELFHPRGERSAAVTCDVSGQASSRRRVYEPCEPDITSVVAIILDAGC